MILNRVCYIARNSQSSYLRILSTRIARVYYYAQAYLSFLFRGPKSFINGWNRKIRSSKPDLHYMRPCFKTKHQKVWVGMGTCLCAHACMRVPVCTGLCARAPVCARACVRVPVCMHSTSILRYFHQPMIPKQLCNTGTIIPHDYLEVRAFHKVGN